MVVFPEKPSLSDRENLLYLIIVTTACHRHDAKNPIFNKQSTYIAYWNVHGLKQDKTNLIRSRSSTFRKLFNENDLIYLSET